jgi:hypothetical protein
MNAFDLFQIATCQIGEGDSVSAAATLAKAIKKCADADMRAELTSLRLKVLENARAEAA